jgi:hypothetical protein
MRENSFVKLNYEDFFNILSKFIGDIKVSIMHKNKCYKGK